MTYKTVAAIKADGFKETLRWDEVSDAYTITRLYLAMGQAEDETLTEQQVTELLARWGQSNMLDDDFKVLEVDEYLTDLIMEGHEWHPLKTTPSKSDE